MELSRSCVACPGLAWLSAHHVPDREALAILVGAALRLVARRRGIPDKNPLADSC